jgi:hypothetical protein
MNHCSVNVPECDFRIALDDTNLPEGNTFADVTEVKTSTDNMFLLDHIKNQMFNQCA